MTKERTNDNLGALSTTENSVAEVVEHELINKINKGSVVYVDDNLNENILDVFRRAIEGNDDRKIVIFNSQSNSFANQYNVVANGSPSDIADRIVLLCDFIDGDTGDAYFKTSAKLGLTTIISAFQAAGLNYDFFDLINVFGDVRELSHLERIIPNTSADKIIAKDCLSAFVSEHSEFVDGVLIKPSQKVIDQIFGRLVAAMQKQVDFEDDSFDRASSERSVHDCQYGINIGHEILNKSVIYIVHPEANKAQEDVLLKRVMLLCSDIKSSIQCLIKSDKASSEDIYVIDDKNLLFKK